MNEQYKRQLATKLYKTGINQFFEKVKDSDWNRMFDSDYIRFLYDPKEEQRLDIGPFSFVRKGSSVIEAQYELSHFGNTIFFTFENKVNEFQEVSNFIDFCYEKLEEYSLQRVQNIEIELPMTEQEKDEIVSKVEESWGPETFVPHYSEPETETVDSATTEVIVPEKTMTEEETAEAVQEYERKNTSNKRGRKNKRSR